MNIKINIEKIRDEAMREFIDSQLMTEIKKNSKPMEEMMSSYKCAMMEVETKFKVLNEEFSLEYDHNPIESIKTRIKSTESLLKKIKRKNISFTPESIEENIYDVAGIRVICSFVDDIYLLADCLLKQDDITLIERKDYIQNPKKSGYRSLHLIVEVPIFLQNEKKLVKVEVQLRTIAMDFWASLEHKLRYKKDLNPKISHQLSLELEKCAEISANLDKRMKEIKNEINRYK